MLLSANIEEKTLGTKLLLKDCRLNLVENVKVGIIGHNGAGKSTLFRVLTGQDPEFHGTLERKNGIRILLTEQEHFGLEDTAAVDYVRASLPHYSQWLGIMQAFEHGEDTSMEALHRYSDAEAKFRERRYYDADERIVEALEAYGLNIDQAYAPMGRLSGGQKRFVELARVSLAEADLVLLDEPTNHMDYLGKARFIEWLREAEGAICLISHDRDVLDAVDEIVELKDRKLYRYPGNYAAYLKQNGTGTITKVAQYEEGLRRLEKLRSQQMLARVRKLSAHSDSGRNNAKTQEERLEREYEELKASLVKPQFWIDRETLENTSAKLTAGYQKYKDRTITVATADLQEYSRELLKAEKLSLGYAEPLFSGLSFSLRHGDRVQVKGRNGAGKTTLVRAILAHLAGIPSDSWTFAGSIIADPKLRLGLYEQEVDEALLPLSLEAGVRELYARKNEPLTDQRLRQTLSMYLFDPIGDARLPISQLSGGQKARLQLIGMLAGAPNLLILDEPTNHLDLPSIEELEKSLSEYEGAILFVSHDSYFVNSLGAETVELQGA